MRRGFFAGDVSGAQPGARISAIGDERWKWFKAVMIETERLLLRPPVLDDFEGSYALLSDPAVMSFIGGPLSREESWHRLLRYAGHWSLLGYGLFVIIEKASGRLLGQTGLADFHRGLGEVFDPYPEAAWITATAAHGRGIAAEAVGAAHAWFDANRPQTRTVCIINPDNTASVRLAGKLGYAPFGQASYKSAEVTMFERIRP